MTEESKKVVLQRIEALRPQSCTNLWHGLKEGLKSFQNAPSVPGNVQALYVLTDGNYIILLSPQSSSSPADISYRSSKPHVSEARIRDKVAVSP